MQSKQNSRQKDPGFLAEPGERTNSFNQILASNSRHKIIGFDIDGVIVDSLLPIHKAFQSYASRYGMSDYITLDYARLNCVVGTPRDIVITFLTTFKDELEQKGIDTQYLLGAGLGEESKEYETAYRQVTVEPTAQDDAIRLLVYLKRQGYKIPLISSGTTSEIAKNLQVVQKRYEELLQLKQIEQVDTLFDVIVGWSDVDPFGKPHTKSMEIAIRKLINARHLKDKYASIPKGIIFIGDGASDMKFAHNINGHGLYLESTKKFDGEEAFAPHATFSNMNDLYREFMKTTK